MCPSLRHLYWFRLFRRQRLPSVPNPTPAAHSGGYPGHGWSGGEPLRWRAGGYYCYEESAGAQEGKLQCSHNILGVSLARPVI